MFDDPTHRRKVVRGFFMAMLGIGVAAMSIGLFHDRFSDLVPREVDVASRLALVLPWLLVPGVSLLVGVVGAARRGIYADAIDGTRAPRSHGLEINLRYNQNTLEQVVLAAIAWVALALCLPRPQLSIIPLLAILFGVGRLAFWIGYRIDPIGRAFGMAMTAAPTIAAYAWLVVHFLVR